MQKKSMPRPITDVDNWHKAHGCALEQYKKAVWFMADILLNGQELFGRGNGKTKPMSVSELSPFSRDRVKWFLSLAKLRVRKNTLTPEHHYELIGNKSIKKWLSRAEREHLKPTELRKLIRGSGGLKREKQIKVASWPKYLLLIEREIKRLPEDLKQRALQEIAALTK